MRSAAIRTRDVAFSLEAIAPAVGAGQRFTMQWTVRNSGNCTWNSGYTLRYGSRTNQQLSLSQTNVPISGTVVPGQSYTFSVPVRAPTTSGTHREDWGLYPAAGQKFYDAWVQIVVSPTAQLPQINSISPASLTANPVDQRVRVNGSGFQAGLTVTVNYPGGSSTLSGPNQIQNVTATSFDMVALLGVAAAMAYG